MTAWITQDYSKTVSGTDYAIGLDITKNGYNIPDGVTANGYQIGIVPEVFVSDANFAGTIDKQYAIWARTGMNVIAPAGARTINNAYGIYIEGLTTPGGTIHNHYGVYQAGSGTKNYFEGNVGIGTTGPSGKVHINAGTASPALRIDTDNAGPWGLIIRNLASGTAGFEVYQSDDGKTHMFSPYPNHGITLDTNGNVGIGTTSPNLGGDRRALTVSAGTSGDWIARLEVQGTRSTDNMYGALDFYHKANNTASIESYRSGADDAGNLTFWTRTSGMTLAERMRIDHLGNVGIGTASPSTRLEVAGEAKATVFTPTSDRNAKENFSPVDAKAVLEKVSGLPITRWSFKELPGTEHVGPMAQDFHAAFGVGADDKHISTVDADGVALAAIQGLHEIVKEQKTELQAKEQKISTLEARLAALEKLVSSLARIETKEAK